MAALRRGMMTIRFWVTFFFGLIILLAVYYIASDRITPMTRDAYVQALVIPIAPLVSGEISEIFVENGDEVKKGEVLFRIDPRAFQFEVDRLQAKLELTRLEFGLQNNTSDNQPAEIRQINSELAKAKLDLSQTTVLAPDKGVVDNMLLSAGVYVGAGKAVMTLINAGEWWIIANYEENALSVIREGQTVEFGLYLFPGQVFAGHVESIGWGVERARGSANGNLPQIDNPSRWVSLSQRFPVRITPSGSIAEQSLRIGASARVVVFSEDGGAMNVVAKSLMRLSATTDYLY